MPLINQNNASFFTILLFLLISDATSMSFSFNTFNKTNIRNITLQGNASHFESAIRLTENKPFQNSQATYVPQIHLWTDGPLEILADFVTNFTFSIDRQNNTNFADGLVFFLAKDYMTLNSTANPFVGVEFDVFNNPWDDIVGPHVGIDYMTLKSLKSSAWDANVQGRRMDAGISYNSLSKTMCVDYTGFKNNVTLLHGFCYKIDLRDYLPERVTIGFSASTGLFSESHIIHSWSFDASLRNLDVLAPTPSPPPQQGAPYPLPQQGAPSPPPQQGGPSPPLPGKRGLAGWVTGLIVMAVFY
ncbi:lectin 8-like [Mercurialis annua]|uniref:lectin 8-like n=1 Tax=Mercurialis annua TaxID=3986 RepID=UPI00215E4A57|nr:lectin 8-like [Mercurialis annua]